MPFNKFFTLSSSSFHPASNLQITMYPFLLSLSICSILDTSIFLSQACLLSSPSWSSFLCILSKISNLFTDTFSLLPILSYFSHLLYLHFYLLYYLNSFLVSSSVSSYFPSQLNQFSCLYSPALFRLLSHFQFSFTLHVSLPHLTHTSAMLST